MDNEAARRRRRGPPSSSLAVTRGDAFDSGGGNTPTASRRKIRKRKRRQSTIFGVRKSVWQIGGAALLVIVILGYIWWHRQSAYPTQTNLEINEDQEHVQVKHEIPKSVGVARHHDEQQFHRRIIPIAHSEQHISCDQETLSEFLHEEPVDGMHVLCFDQGTSVGRLEITIYKGAQFQKNDAEQTFGEFSWHGIRDALQMSLELRAENNPRYQPWAIFTSTGQRIVGQEDPYNEESQESYTVAKSILDSGLVLLMEGGQWIWPGVRAGFQRTINLHSILPESPRQEEDRTVVLETLSLRPLVLSVEGFLSHQECDYIENEAAPRVKYSNVVLMDKDKGRPASDFRTSQSTFLSASDETLRKVDYRTASLVRIPRSHQEILQVLRYGPGEKYNAHHDYFDPALYQNDPATLATIQNGKRNRLATVFWYLSTVEEGGETLFPRWNGAPSPRDMADCSYGLRVKPIKGNVIIFYSMTPGGNVDPLSLHAACPVKEGVKWAANKWVWNSPMHYIKEQ